MNRPTHGTILVRRPAGSLNRWNDVEQMQRQIDDVVSGLFGYSPAAPAKSGVGFAPDLYETEEALVLVAPLPGIDPENLQIEATEDTLKVKGEQKPFYQNEKARLVRQGHGTSARGEFEFNYALPIQINPENVQAHYRNGVLELHLPKAEAVKPKTIKVNVSAE